jgi:hypothetical protein
MDSAVALARAYLHFNGYFTVTEFPVVEAISSGSYRSVTDVDLLAVRLPGAGRIIPRRGQSSSQAISIPGTDPVLEADDSRVDMIIAEVKSGQAELNRGSRNPAVLRTALTRFGGMREEEIESLVGQLMKKGEAISKSGPRIRLMAFGSYRGRRSGRGYSVITHRQILTFAATVSRQYWRALQHTQTKDPAVEFLMLLRKSGIRFDVPSREWEGDRS